MSVCVCECECQACDKGEGTRGSPRTEDMSVHGIVVYCCKCLAKLLHEILGEWRVPVRPPVVSFKRRQKMHPVVSTLESTIIFHCSERSATPSGSALVPNSKCKQVAGVVVAAHC